jgi:hypothetical protein
LGEGRKARHEPKRQGKDDWFGVHF